MDYLYWQNIDNSQFNVFIRDLSEKLNSNVKNIIEDSYNDIKKEKVNKNKKPKKKDLIIKEQTEKRNKKLYEGDLKKISYFMDILDINKPYEYIKHLKTDEGILEYKFKLLEKAWKPHNKKRDFEKIIGIYYQVSQSNTNNPVHINILDRINNTLDNYDYRLYMLQKLGHILPPLNLWDKKDYRLEDWQLKVFNYIKKNESVLVRAPTSSGKSFIGMGVATIHNKILYVCPIEPVAFQVGSHFTKMGYRVKYLLPNFEYFFLLSIDFGFPLILAIVICLHNASNCSAKYIASSKFLPKVIVP